MEIPDLRHPLLYQSPLYLEDETPLDVDVWRMRRYRLNRDRQELDLLRPERAFRENAEKACAKFD